MLNVAAIPHLAPAESKTRRTKGSSALRRRKDLALDPFAEMAIFAGHENY